MTLPTSPPKPLTVYVFNVDQGDNMLFELPDGTFGLLDFNYNWKINLALEPPALTFLKDRHRESPVVLSFICLSHPDLDHIKGVERVIEWIDDNDIRVDRIWLYPGVNERTLGKAMTRAIADLKKIIRQNEAEGMRTPSGFRTVSEIKQIKKGLAAIWRFAERRNISVDLLQGVVSLANLAKGAVEVCPLAPLARQIEASNRTTLHNLFLWTLRFREKVMANGNLVSSVIKMRYGRQQLICGGDAGREVLEECLDEFAKRHQNNEGPCYSSCRVSFVKASHHGAAGSSSLQLWERILSRRTHVVLSAGRNYRLKHPSRETIDQINEAARNLGAETQILTTNLCDSCLNRPNLDVEHFDWFPKKPLRSKRKESNVAVLKCAPISASTSQKSKSPEAQRSTLGYTPALQRDDQSKEERSLAGYILRLTPDSDEAEFKYATMPFTQARTCFFGGKREQRFPDCATAIRSKI